MLPSINMMSAAADSTAVKSDELQRSTTSISDTTPTDIEDIPSDTIPVLSKRELRRQRVANRNLHYNILGGPSYTPDFGLLVGGSALMTFRMNPSDTTQRRSVVPMAIALMFKGGLNLMTKPQLFFKGDRFRIFGRGGTGCLPPVRGHLFPLCGRRGADGARLGAAGQPGRR